MSGHYPDDERIGRILAAQAAGDERVARELEGEDRLRARLAEVKAERDTREMERNMAEEHAVEVGAERDRLREENEQLRLAVEFFRENAGLAPDAALNPPKP